MVDSESLLCLDFVLEKDVNDEDDADEEDVLFFRCSMAVCVQDVVMEFYYLTVVHLLLVCKTWIFSRRTSTSRVFEQLPRK